MKYVLCSNGLMETVQSLNRNWIDDTYFSLYRPIRPGEKSEGYVRGEMSEYHPKHLNIHLSGCRWESGSTSVRGPVTGDSFGLLRIVLLTGVIYLLFLETFNIIKASAESASE